jgi:hypothetical protein
MKITLGADPEIFIRNNTTKTFVSAHNIVEGTKKEPKNIFKGAIQVDGVALEYNIKPAKTMQEFAAYNNVLIKQLQEIVKEKNPDLSLAITPTAWFEQNYFDMGIPENAKILGCEPDFNAYTGEMNPIPITNKPMRTGAGHLHIGWTEKADINSPAHFYDCIAVTKQLDHSIGFLSHLWDPDKERQELYGKMGSFRPKPYGVEYRPLSNAWVRYPKLYPWLFKAVEKAMNDLEQNKKYWENANIPFKDIEFPNKFPNILFNKEKYHEVRKNISLYLNINYKHYLTQNQQVLV